MGTQRAWAEKIVKICESLFKKYFFCHSGLGPESSNTIFSGFRILVRNDN